MNPTIDLMKAHRSIRKVTNRYPQKHDANMLAAYDRTTNHYYYLNRNSNLKDETWTHQMADLMGRVFRPHMKAFLESKGFFLK